MKFNYRTKDLEVRSCDKNLLSDGEHDRAEIIKWSCDDNKEFCFALAYWVRGSEGYYLKFVGSRPFGVNGELFMILARQGQQILDHFFNTDQ